MYLGVDISGNRPIIATTIMISPSVKSLLSAVRIFILDLSFVNGVNTATSGLLLFQLVFTYCLLLTVIKNVTGSLIQSTSNINFSYPILTRPSVRCLADEGLPET